MKIYIGIAILLLAAAVFESNYVPQADNSFGFLFPFFIVGFRPLLTYIGAITSFSKHPRLSESIQYIFHREKLEIVGESFDSRLSWNKIVKVSKTKNWLLIYQTGQSANIIPLTDTNELDLAFLKEVLEENKVKNNL